MFFKLSSMGHDIDIIIDNETVDSTYISNNWSDLHTIWYVGDDMHGYRGKEVARRAKRALRFLKEKHGIEPAKVPYPPYGNWGYGMDRKNNRLEDNERKAIFAYLIHEFMLLGDKYPLAKFMDDQTYCLSEVIKYTDYEDDDDIDQTFKRVNIEKDDYIESEEEEEEEENEKKENKSSIHISSIKLPNNIKWEELPLCSLNSQCKIESYTIHPFRGGPMIINTYEKAIQLYGYYSLTIPETDHSKWCKLADVFKYYETNLYTFI